jgi:hypothetical protein
MLKFNVMMANGESKIPGRRLIEPQLKSHSTLAFKPELECREFLGLAEA